VLGKAARFDWPVVIVSLDFQGHDLRRPRFPVELFIDLSADRGKQDVETHP